MSIFSSEASRLEDRTSFMFSGDVLKLSESKPNVSLIRELARGVRTGVVSLSNTADISTLGIFLALGAGLPSALDLEPSKEACWPLVIALRM